jgi:hypothetical protein
MQMERQSVSEGRKAPEVQLSGCVCEREREREREREEEEEDEGGAGRKR